MQKISNYDRLIKVASEAKTALLTKWEDDGFFRDNGIYRIDDSESAGFLSEAVGLTSLLLMLVAFKNEPQIISEDDNNKIANITDLTLKKLSEWVKEDGFTATPWLLAEDSEDFFTPEVGYIDTISWVTSAAILVRYAERRHIAQFSSDTHDASVNLISLGLKQLLNSQRDDGTWGFMAEKEASKSLYFTYVAGAALSDFYDYVLGQIEDVENSIEDNRQENYKDTELIAILDENLGFDVTKAVEKARDNLRLWLLRDCLPLLPVLSSCGTTDEYAEHLGLWNHETSNPYKNDGIDYFNLYYTYYLIDLMVLTESDKKYAEIIQSEQNSEFKELKNHYEKYIINQTAADNNSQKNRGIKLLNDDDYRYYFRYDNQSNAEYFWINFVEQAIHTSRNHYMRASRTGQNFWNSRKSEFEIYWLHDDPEKNEIAKEKTNIPRMELTDPALAPLSLRINACYSYYISEQPDIAVDRLFLNICNDASSDTRNKRVKGLWDNIDYSLMITERSIEAIVDYYDYLCKFEMNQKDSEPDEPCKQIVIPTKSDFEIMFEQKIGEYMQSEAGKEIIRKSVDAADVANPHANVHLSQKPAADEFLSSIDYILDLVSRKEFLDEHGDDEERLRYKLTMVMRELSKTSLKDYICSVTEKYDDEIDSDYARRVHDSANQFIKEFKALLTTLLHDLDKLERESFVDLYDKLNKK